MHILGIGLIYLGKRNIQYYFNICTFCGQFTKVQSYDVTQYFSLHFPLFPIDQRRILRCCACEKKIDKSIKNQELDEHNQLEPLIELYQKAPDDIKVIKQILSVIINFQDKAMFYQISPLIGNDKVNIELLEILGDTHLYFIDLNSAAENYRLALEGEDLPHIREKLGLIYILQLRPDEANPYLNHILNEQKEDSFGLIPLLVECFQIKGKHREALNVLNDWAEYFPNHVGKMYRKLVIISQKHLNYQRCIKPKRLKMFLTKIAPKKGISPKLANKLGLPFVILFLGGLTLIIINEILRLLYH